MTRKNKLRYLLALLSAQMFFVVINSTTVSAQNDLFVEGNVLGYELYEVRPVSNVLFPVLLKITKVVNGVEKSDYIVVKMLNLYKEYAEENFGLNKITKFRLQRKTFCDTKIKNLFRPGLTIQNGKVVRKSQTFTLVPEVEKDLLPLKKKIPCYIESFDSKN